jgi:hypothetical protein
VTLAAKKPTSRVQYCTMIFFVPRSGQGLSILKGDVGGFLEFLLELSSQCDVMQLQVIEIAIACIEQHGGW